MAEAVASCYAAAAAWQLRDFCLYQAARSVVIVGAEAQSVAVAWQVYQITPLCSSPSAGDRQPFALFLPGHLLRLSCKGHAADRFDRRTIILLCYTLQAVCHGALAHHLRVARRPATSGPSTPCSSSSAPAAVSAAPPAPHSCPRSCLKATSSTPSPGAPPSSRFGPTSAGPAVGGSTLHPPDAKPHSLDGSAHRLSLHAGRAALVHRRSSASSGPSPRRQ